MDYERTRATAERLIAKHGRSTPAILKRSVAADDPTPWDPSDDEGTSVGEYPCRIVVTEFNALERSNSMIGMADKKVLISTEGLSVTPSSSDVLVIDGQPHEIRSIAPIQPGDIVILYEAQVAF